MTDDRTDAPSAERAREEIRLRELGYLAGPVERFLALAHRSRRFGTLALTAAAATILGVMLAGLVSAGHLIAAAEIPGGLTGTLLLAGSLAGAYVLFFFLVLVVPAFIWSRGGRNRTERAGSALLAEIINVLAAGATSAYLFGWWHALLRPSRELLPFGWRSLLMMAGFVAASLVVGRLTGLSYLLTSGVPRRNSRRGNERINDYRYVLAVVLLIAAGWILGVFREHSAHHNLAGALAAYEPPSLPVLLVGLDGLDRLQVESMAAADSLPVLGGLIDEGYRAALISRSDYLAPQVWTTVATGVNPEVHGMQGLTRRVPWGMGDAPPLPESRPDLDRLLELMLPFRDMVRLEPTETAPRMTRTLWEIYELFGAGAGVVNWWSSWPAGESRGFTLSERVFPKIAYFHRQQAINPSSYYQREVWPAAEFDSLVTLAQRLERPFEDLLARFPRLRAVVDNPEGGEAAELVRSLCFADYFYCMAALENAARHPVKVMVVYLQGADILSRLEERAEGEMDLELEPLEREYARFADHLLGLLINSFQPGGLLTVVCEPGKIDRLAGAEGLALFHGLDVRRGGASEEPARLEDIAPTMLYLTGLPVSRNMSGRVIREAGQRGPGGAIPLRYVSSYGPPPQRPEVSGAPVRYPAAPRPSAD